MRIQGIIAYDGSEYYGFQRQKKEPRTIQQTLENVLSTIFQQEIQVIGSGRTDRGVHALNQSIHFDIPKDQYPLDQLKYSLNKMLPNTILIKSLNEVPSTFHARISAKGKHYQYRILLEDNPFYNRYRYIYHKKLDVSLIREGMKLFIGKHMFYNFCGNKEIENDYEKTIFDFQLKEENKELVFDIYGDGFKRYMVRMIIGTLLALGDHQIDLEYIKEKLEAPLGNNTSYNAPAQGLFLVEVFYDTK